MKALHINNIHKNNKWLIKNYFIPVTIESKSLHINHNAALEWKLWDYSYKITKNKDVPFYGVRLVISYLEKEEAPPKENIFTKITRKLRIKGLDDEDVDIYLTPKIRKLLKKEYVEKTYDPVHNPIPCRPEEAAADRERILAIRANKVKEPKKRGRPKRKKKK